MCARARGNTWNVTDTCRREEKKTFTPKDREIERRESDTASGGRNWNALNQWCGQDLTIVGRGCFSFHRFAPGIMIAGKNEAFSIELVHTSEILEIQFKIPEIVIINGILQLHLFL